MPTKSFIPAKDVDFHGWQGNFVIKVDLFKVNWDWSDTVIAEWTLLTNTPGKKKKYWDVVWPVIFAGNFKPSQDHDKTRARKDYEFGDRKNKEETSLRLFITRNIRNNVLVTDLEKEEMGLLVPDDILTAPTGVDGLKIANILSGKVRDAAKTVQLSEIQINGQKSRAKPEDVKDIQIFIAITESSVKTAPDVEAFAYDGVTKGGLYKRTFLLAQEGKRAWYYARFMYKGKLAKYGQPSGIWSEIII